MKSLFKYTVFLVTLILILNSCSKSNKEVKMIPSNALVVLHFNARALSVKLSWDDIKHTGWYRELYNDTAIKAWTKKLMDNPSVSGIDFDDPLVIFLQKTPGDAGQIVFEGNVKNAVAFEAFNKNFDQVATTSKEGDVSTLMLKEEMVVGWTAKKFAYVVNTPNLPQGINAGPATSNPGLIQVCKKLFALKTDSSMANIARFSTLLKEEADVHIWQNTEAMVNSSTQFGAISMLKLDALLKGNMSTASATFDNGKISVKQKFYVSPELTDVLKKYGGGKINTEMIRNIPSQNINGLLAINFKPEGLKEIIKLTGMDGMINSFLSRQEITIDDFVKANKGDLIFAMTDFTVKKDSFNFKEQARQDTSFAYNRPPASFLFSVTIGDKPSFDKLMTLGKKLGGSLTDNLGIYFAGNNKVFAMGSSQRYVSQYIAGNNNKFDFIDKIKDHPIAFFVDLQKILSHSSSTIPVRDSSTKILFDESLKTWQNVFSTGGEYQNDAFVMNTEINLVDKNINSLKQLNTYLDRMCKVLIEKKKKYQQGWLQADSSMMYPPKDNRETMPGDK